MFNKLNEIIESLKGNVLVIGLDNKLLSTFAKNSNVNLYSITESLSKRKILGLKSKHKMITNKGKNINIKKLKKYIARNSADYVIINFDTISKYYKYVIRDSILINRKQIIIYSTNDLESEFVISKYKRYNVDINLNNYKNGYIVSIDNKETKRNIIKNKLYFIADTFYDIADIISNILVS